MLKESSGHKFNDSQFGFVSPIAIGIEEQRLLYTALVNDVSSFANVRGSTVPVANPGGSGACLPKNA